MPDFRRGLHDWLKLSLELAGAEYLVTEIGDRLAYFDHPCMDPMYDYCMTLMEV